MRAGWHTRTVGLSCMRRVVWILEPCLECHYARALKHALPPSGGCASHAPRLNHSSRSVTMLRSSLAPSSVAAEVAILLSGQNICRAVCLPSSLPTASRAALSSSGDNPACVPLHRGLLAQMVSSLASLRIPCAPGPFPPAPAGWLTRHSFLELETCFTARALHEWPPGLAARLLQRAGKFRGKCDALVRPPSWHLSCAEGAFRVFLGCCCPHAASRRRSIERAQPRVRGVSDGRRSVLRGCLPDGQCR